MEARPFAASIAAVPDTASGWPTRYHLTFPNGPINGVSVDFCDKSDLLANRFLIEPVFTIVHRVPLSLLLLPGPYSVRAPTPVEPPWFRRSRLPLSVLPLLLRRDRQASWMLVLYILINRVVTWVNDLRYWRNLGYHHMAMRLRKNNVFSLPLVLCSQHLRKRDELILVPTSAVVDFSGWTYPRMPYASRHSIIQ